jgi:DNA-binding GntR family transcriptional regulator
MLTWVLATAIFLRMDTATIARDIQISTKRQTVGDNLYDELLAAIHAGRFAPGERINDVALARELGISRTPVREALQRLKSLGVVEAEPNRFTRVAVIPPETVRDYTVVWGYLMRGLIDEIDAKVPAKVLREMKAHHAAFLKAIASENARKVALENFEFFTSLTDLTSNQPLFRTLDSVQHVIRLGSVTLPDWVDLETLSTGQEALLAALTAGDRHAAHKALDVLRTILIPGTAA